MSRDTLLLITTSYPERNDGSEAAGAFVADIAAELSRHAPVRVVAPGTRAGSVERSDGITVYRFSAPGRALSLLSPTNPTHWPAIVGTLASMRTQVHAASADHRIRHALALWTLPSGWAAASLKKRQGVPYSVWALGSDIWSLGRIPGVRGFLGRVMRGADNCYADGLQLADDAAVIAGRAFTFLPSTRRLHRARTSPLATSAPYRLLFLGRWHPNKGVDLLLDALHQLDSDTWARIAEVHIAGGGPLQAHVESAVLALQSAGRPVRLSGFLDREQASDALLHADYLLLPSRVESIPVVFSDAMKSGLPVVAMPVGDLPRLMEGDRVGAVAEAVSAEAFAAALVRALDSAPSLHSEAMSKLARSFDLSHVAEVLLTAMNDPACPEGARSA